MDQKFFIIILIIFLLTNNFSQVMKDIFKGLIYLLLLFGLIKIINPNIEKKIKENLVNIINSDQGLFTNSVSVFASYFKKIIKTSIVDKETTKMLDTVYTIPNKSNTIINTISSLFSKSEQNASNQNNSNQNTSNQNNSNQNTSN
jgi:hypothetical protein